MFGSEISSPARPATNSAADPALRYAESMLVRAHAEIDRADAKASILLAASGVVVGALLAGLIAGTWTPLRLPGTVQWLWWLGVATAASGIWCLAWAVYPRREVRESAIPWAVGYYVDVLAFSSTAELVTALRRSADTNVDRVAEQLRQVSRIAHRKYFFIRCGMRLLFLAVMTTSAAVVISPLSR